MLDTLAIELLRHIVSVGYLKSRDVAAICCACRKLHSFRVELFKILNTFQLKGVRSHAWSLSDPNLLAACMQTNEVLSSASTDDHHTNFKIHKIFLYDFDSMTRKPLELTSPRGRPIHFVEDVRVAWTWDGTKLLCVGLERQSENGDETKPFSNLDDVLVIVDVASRSVITTIPLYKEHETCDERDTSVFRENKDERGRTPWSCIAVSPNCKLAILATNKERHSDPTQDRQSVWDDGMIIMMDLVSQTELYRSSSGRCKWFGVKEAIWECDDTYLVRENDYPIYHRWKVDLQQPKPIGNFQERMDIFDLEPPFEPPILVLSSNKKYAAFIKTECESSNSVNAFVMFLTHDFSVDFRYSRQPERQWFPSGNKDGRWILRHLPLRNLQNVSPCNKRSRTI
eukprot:m.141584 g.141584  ORF g.141584 m.141584 type:complete len:398 (+) comp14853_c0_seq4:103-1296(+)